MFCCSGANLHFLTYISLFLLDPVSTVTQVMILTPLSAVLTLLAPTHLELVAVRVKRARHQLNHTGAPLKPTSAALSDRLI